MRSKLVLALIGLMLLFEGDISGTQGHDAGLQTREAPSTKYPPYPDVWDWHEPLAESGYPEMYNMANGDVLIPFHKKATKPKNQRRFAVTFFQRTTLSDVHAEGAIENAVDVERARPRAVSPDGRWKTDYGHFVNTYCYGGPNRDPYKIVDTTTGGERIFTIFRLLDRPEEFFVDARCESERTRTVRYKVKSVAGGFLFLKDDTFLFRVESTGEVIRFDTNLESKSTLMENQFFLIENSGYPRVIDELTGKEYDEFEDAEVIADDLYQYLKNRRRGR
jgi:hypothetical protein